MNTPNLSRLIIESLRKDLEIAEKAAETWQTRVKEIKSNLLGHEKHAAKVERLAKEEAAKAAQ